MINARVNNKRKVILIMGSWSDILVSSKSVEVRTVYLILIKIKIILTGKRDTFVLRRTF